MRPFGSALARNLFGLGVDLARAAAAASSSPPAPSPLTLVDRTMRNAVDPVAPSARRVLAWGQNPQCPVCGEPVARPEDGGLLMGSETEPDRVAHVIPCFALELSRRGHPMMTTALTRAQREGTA